MHPIVFFFLRILGILVITKLALWLSSLREPQGPFSAVLRLLAFWGAVAYFLAPYLADIQGIRIFRGGYVRETPEAVWRCFGMLCLLAAGLGLLYRLGWG